MTADRRAIRARLIDDVDDDAIVVTPPDGASLRTDTDGSEPVAAVLHAIGGGRHLLVDNGARTAVVIGDPVPAPGGASVREVLVDGFRFEVRTESDHLAGLRERATRTRPDGGRAARHEVRAIIPGKVVSVSVTVGDTVSAGQQLLVVEAMKMQNELRAPRAGSVTRIAVGAGSTVELGDVLVVLE